MLIDRLARTLRAQVQRRHATNTDPRGSPAIKTGRAHEHLTRSR
jgi:hypothetical protein